MEDCIRNVLNYPIHLSNFSGALIENLEEMWYDVGERRGREENKGMIDMIQNMPCIPRFISKQDSIKFEVWMIAGITCKVYPIPQ